MRAPAFLRPVFYGVIFSLFLLSCSGKDDVVAIRELIKEGARLAEARDIGGIMELSTGDFTALPGSLDRRGTRGLLWRAFKYYGDLKVLYPEPSVTLESDGLRALASVPFLIVRKEHSLPKLRELYKDPVRWIEEAGKNADLYRLKLDLIKEGGDWFVKIARLEKFKGVGFGP